jgi:type IV pilus assembly protein PilV
MLITRRTLVPRFRMAHGQRGFTLLEVLVAVLILAIGLLGMAALQVAGLRNNHSAYLRSQATQLAYDMADRIRANPQGVTNGNYNNPTAAQTAACLTTSGCDSAQMAGHDAYEWNADLTSQLPGGAGRVCIDGTPDDGTSAAPACDGAGSVYAIKVWWNDDYDRTNNQVVVRRFVMSFQP